MEPQIAEVGDPVKASSGSNADQVRQKKACRVNGIKIAVAGIVACRRDAQNAVLLLSLNGVMKSLRESDAAPAVIRRDNVHSAIFHGFHEVKTGHRPVHRAASGSVQELASHDLN